MASYHTISEVLGSKVKAILSDRPAHIQKAILLELLAEVLLEENQIEYEKVYYTQQLIISNMLFEKCNEIENQIIEFLNEN